MSSHELGSYDLRPIPTEEAQSMRRKKAGFRERGILPAKAWVPWLGRPRAKSSRNSI